MENGIFLNADILIPKSDIDMTKWSVVACDQYTSERSYWEELKNIIGEDNSTLKMVFPEVYLEDEDFEQRIENIGKEMSKALKKDIFYNYSDAMVYVKRTLANGKVRHGIMGVIDLEAYNYGIGSESMIRATEGTILERIPPRVQIRNKCYMEIPHVMLLIDNGSCNIIEAIASKADQLQRIYDFELIKDSGNIAGYLLNAECKDILEHGIRELSDKSMFNEKYATTDEEVLLFAVGDGNHSLATAKKCYENLKHEIGDRALNSKARYALVEVVNLHDESLVFEAIHRVVFEVNVEHMYEKLCDQFQMNDTFDELEHNDFVVITKGKEEGFFIKKAVSNIVVGDLQKFLDDYVIEYGGSIDYIHGDDVVRTLCEEDEHTVGFLLKSMEKTDLFKTVIVDGALPRKTFSMGEASDKRFYLEARTIV